MWSFEGRKPRNLLSPKQAIQIYSLKPSDDSEIKGSNRVSVSRRIATDFGVSSKAIRDIWNHRTWKDVTHPEDKANQQSHKSIEQDKCKCQIFQVSTLFSILCKMSWTELVGHSQRPSGKSCSNQSIEVQANGLKQNHKKISAQEIDDMVDTLTESFSGNSTFFDPFHSDWPHWDRAA